MALSCTVVKPHLGSLERLESGLELGLELDVRLFGPGALQPLNATTHTTHLGASVVDFYFELQQSEGGILVGVTWEMWRWLSACDRLKSFTISISRRIASAFCCPWTPCTAGTCGIESELRVK